MTQHAESAYDMGTVASSLAMVGPNIGPDPTRGPTRPGADTEDQVTGTRTGRVQS